MTSEYSEWQNSAIQSQAMGKCNSKDAMAQATNLPCDPRAAQLLALFQMSDERGKVTLLAIAGIHAARYPKEKS